MPCTVNSMRTLCGRFISRVNGATAPGPTSILPLMRTDCTAFSFSRPPLAWTFFSISSSAVCAPAAVAARAATISHAKDLRTMVSLLVRMLGGTGKDSGFGRRRPTGRSTPARRECFAALAALGGKPLLFCPAARRHPGRRQIMCRSSKRLPVALPLAFVALALGVAAAGPLPAAVDPALLAGMKARAIGPATTSRRISAVEAAASAPNVLYVGAASGGVWESVDGGRTWETSFDDQPAA